MTTQFITFYKTIAEWLDRELPNLPINSLWSPQQGKQLSWFMQHLIWDRYRLIYMGGVNVSIGMTQLCMTDKPLHRFWNPLKFFFALSSLVWMKIVIVYKVLFDSKWLARKYSQIWLL